jgi:RNA polymerase sigma factor (sigma-70 family)
MDDLAKLIADRGGGDDDEVIARIAKLIYPAIYLRVLQKVKVDDAADLTQDILLQIVKGFRLFRGDSQAEFFGWCYAITRAQIGRYYRNLEKQSETTHPDFEEFHRLVDQYALKHQMTESEKREMHEIAESLQKADPGCFELIFRRHVLDDDFKTIGADLGISADAARMRINKCIEKFNGD